VELVERKTEVRWLWSKFLVSQRRICELLDVAESSQRYASRRNDEELRTSLVEAAREEPKWGYRRLQLKLEAKGLHVNHKRVYRVYREAGLLIRRRRRKRLRRAGFVRPVVTGANQEWAMDFVHDAAESGRKFRQCLLVGFPDKAEGCYSAPDALVIASDGFAVLLEDGEFALNC